MTSVLYAKFMVVFKKKLHPKNLTWPLKNDGWKMNFLLGLSIFGGVC